MRLPQNFWGRTNIMITKIQLVAYFSFNRLKKYLKRQNANRLVRMIHHATDLLWFDLLIQVLATIKHRDLNQIVDKIDPDVVSAKIRTAQHAWGISGTMELLRRVGYKKLDAIRPDAIADRLSHCDDPWYARAAIISLQQIGYKHLDTVLKQTGIKIIW